jgi:hypothetical protein
MKKLKDISKFNQTLYASKIGFFQKSCNELGAHLEKIHKFHFRIWNATRQLEMKLNLADMEFFVLEPGRRVRMFTCFSEAKSYMMQRLVTEDAGDGVTPDSTRN